MAILNLKPTHKAIKEYFAELKKLSKHDAQHEGAVAPAFAALLRYCGNQMHLTLAEQYRIRREKNEIIVDGALLDSYNLAHGYWEAKDSADDLDAEVKKKFKAGYPKGNILFQSPSQAILWQDGKEYLNTPITEPAALIEVLKAFFEYQPPEYEEWHVAVEEFKDKVPELANALLEKIRDERKSNKNFITAFQDFSELCRASINPNISEQAVEEMLIQHLLTERIFRTVFDNADFRRRNVIAREIENVIDALTSQAFSRQVFLDKINRFYVAIESTASVISDYSEKQAFLNTVYENFFQGFSVKVADTHGIVYTPQSIVDFMVKSVDEILKQEFGKSLSDKGVHILDPFVGTGNFITRTLREMNKTNLPYKYANELHCNEVMLLPYYIASMNIEHEYYELTGKYEPFEGICLVDTFELAEDKQMELFTEENTERVKRQQEAPIFVIIANPPYNAKQVNENDNNKNRKYKVLDQRVRETYTKDSKATNKNALSDVYVKAYRWASDRIGDEGIVAFVSNNSFIENFAFDGMRKQLAEDFDSIYVLDLGGNVRQNPKISGTTHNVFGIKVGISINFLVKSTKQTKQTQIYYSNTDEYWRRDQKYKYLDLCSTKSALKFEKLKPDERVTWITKGLERDFETFIPIGTKSAKSGTSTALFRNYSIGTTTNRDAWVYNFHKDRLKKSVEKLVDTYNSELLRWQTRGNETQKLDDFVTNDPKKIKWSSRLKEALNRGEQASFNPSQIRTSLYRPYCSQTLYFDRILTHRRGQIPKMLPNGTTSSQNLLICVSGIGSSKPFQSLVSSLIPNHDLLEKTQCFPFYTYDEDGSNRQENITDWALSEFQSHYKSKRGAAPKISKWDIFYYVYSILHHPEYREKYQANLKRELPRIPFAPDFKGFAKAGKKLADLHANYEDQSEYPLELIETPDMQRDMRVEKMKFNKDKSKLIYNDFLTLGGIPPEVFEYKLGNRSALEWIVDQYRVKTDKRSGIVNDPNREDDDMYIVDLIKKVVTISLETNKIVSKLPELGVD